jgi:heme/copper-type cytochrome/quinol oxidase subunit 3
MGSFKNAIDALIITIVLGLFFIILQMFEYNDAFFTLADGVYGCCFYFLTGLHGIHVFAGVTFIFICLVRLCKRHYLRNHYLGFVFAS